MGKLFARGTEKSFWHETPLDIYNFPKPTNLILNQALSYRGKDASACFAGPNTG